MIQEREPEKQNERPSEAGPPTAPRLPPNLAEAGVETLVERYLALSDCWEAGETRLGRHPTRFNRPEDTEPDPLVQEVLEAGLRAIVQEMAAVTEAVGEMPGGYKALLRARGQTEWDFDAEAELFMNAPETSPLADLARTR